MRRLFFALWPDDALRAAVVAATAEALAEAGGRPVPPENLHVTLAFLGDVAGERLADAVAAARTVTAATARQRFDRIACWGRGGPLVLEATHPDAALGALQASLANALFAADFQLERREFRPHVTLSRRPLRRPAARPPASPGSVLDWACAGFVLAASETRPEGSRYTVLERFPPG